MQFHFILKSSGKYLFRCYVTSGQILVYIWCSSLVELLADIELTSIFIVMVVNVIYFAVAMFQFALVR